MVKCNKALSHQKGILVAKKREYDFHCPKCKKKADTSNPMFVRYTMRRLELPIFLCSECRKIYIDKSTVRREIAEWRRGGTFYPEQSIGKLYKEFLGELEEMVRTHWVPRLGYKRARFIKRRAKQNP